jgi:cytochrome c-type biogenesis protein CcmH/NrfF
MSDASLLHDTPTPSPSPQGGGESGCGSHLPLAGRPARFGARGGGAKPRHGTWLASLMLSFCLASSLPTYAVQPDEVLADAALEARARAISAELRCMVCQNQSIDDSDAELARDLRVLVRERLVAGDTDEQVLAYVVSRYGEFVLLRPTFNARNAMLWGTPLLILLAGGGYLLTRRQRKSAADSASLSAEEEARVADLLRQGE